MMQLVNCQISQSIGLIIVVNDSAVWLQALTLPLTQKVVKMEVKDNRWNKMSCCCKQGIDWASQWHGAIGSLSAPQFYPFSYKLYLPWTRTKFYRVSAYFVNNLQNERKCRNVVKYCRTSTLCVLELRGTYFFGVHFVMVLNCWRLLV